MLRRETSFCRITRASAPSEELKSSYDPGRDLPYLTASPAREKIQDFLRGYRFFYPQSFPANIDDLFGGIRTKRAVEEDKWRIIISATFSSPLMRL